MTEFDCPDCDHSSTHRFRITGFIRVFLHFFLQHPARSARAGSPFSEQTAPEFDQSTETDTHEADG